MPPQELPRKASHADDVLLDIGVVDGLLAPVALTELVRLAAAGQAVAVPALVRWVCAVRLLRSTSATVGGAVLLLPAVLAEVLRLTDATDIVRPALRVGGINALRTTHELSLP